MSPSPEAAALVATAYERHHTRLISYFADDLGVGQEAEDLAAQTWLEILDRGGDRVDERVLDLTYLHLCARGTLARHTTPDRELEQLTPFAGHDGALIAVTDSTSRNAKTDRRLVPSVSEVDFLHVHGGDVSKSRDELVAA